VIHKPAQLGLRGMLTAAWVPGWRFYSVFWCPPGGRSGSGSVGEAELELAAERKRGGVRTRRGEGERGRSAARVGQRGAVRRKVLESVV